MSRTDIMIAMIVFGIGTAVTRSIGGLIPPSVHVDRMMRTTTALLGIATVALAAWLLYTQ
jgi:predicted MFS family arabinose efflux permease